jgi:hypothetical protein
LFDCPTNILSAFAPSWSSSVVVVIIIRSLNEVVVEKGGGVLLFVALFNSISLKELNASSPARRSSFSSFSRSIEPNGFVLVFAIKAVVLVVLVVNILSEKRVILLVSQSYLLLCLLLRVLRFFLRILNEEYLSNVMVEYLQEERSAR